ncbi:MAG: hypothetical protein R2741_03875 [Methanolobus sp.]
MELLSFIGSGILFALFAAVVLFVLINMSSRLAMIILFIIPVLAVLIMPETITSFLSIRHMLLANGLVPINNYHILLMLWSTLIGIILYTEFLTWYLSKERSTKKAMQDKSKGSAPAINIQENIFAVVEKAKKGLLKRN